MVVALSGFFILKAMDRSKVNTDSSSNQEANSSNATSSASLGGNSIVFENGEFSPSTLTVKAGDTITLKNNSNEPIQFDSDPHPLHTDNTELNVGTVNPSETRSFTVDKKGSWGYHNHLAPDEKGKIVVE